MDIRVKLTLSSTLQTKNGTLHPWKKLEITQPFFLPAKQQATHSKNEGQAPQRPTMAYVLQMNPPKRVSNSKFRKSSMGRLPAQKLRKNVYASSTTKNRNTRPRAIRRMWGTFFMFHSTRLIETLFSKNPDFHKERGSSTHFHSKKYYATGKYAPCIVRRPHSLR